MPSVPDTRGDGVLWNGSERRRPAQVLLSIFLKGHELPLMGWGGVALASAGILAEASSKRH